MTPTSKSAKMIWGSKSSDATILWMEEILHCLLSPTHDYITMGSWAVQIPSCSVLLEGRLEILTARSTIGVTVGPPYSLFKDTAVRAATHDMVGDQHSRPKNGHHGQELSVTFSGSQNKVS